MHAPPTELIEAAAAAPWVGPAVGDVHDVIAWDVRKRSAAVWFECESDARVSNPDVLLRYKGGRWSPLSGSSATPRPEPDRKPSLGGFGIPISSSVTRSIGTLNFLTAGSCSRLEVEGRKIEIGPTGFAIIVFSTREKPSVAGFAISGERIGTFHMSEI